jgi:hypothetical protein
MMHLTEEQLISYHDGEIRNRESFAAHLNECPQCRRELERIEAVFAALDAMPVPDPGEDFGRRVWQQIAPRLPEKRARWWQSFFEPHRLLAFGGVAALMLLAFLVGRWYPRTPATPPSIAGTGKTNERVLVVAVGEHLGRSEMVLMELANAEPEKGQKLVNISAEQKRAEDLLEENRLYRQTALRDGDAVMASTLDELERVLLDIANSPDQVTPGQFEAIQKRIAAKGILLKVRVVDQQLRQRGSGSNVEDAPRETNTSPAGNKI